MNRYVYACMHADVCIRLDVSICILIGVDVCMFASVKRKLFFAHMNIFVMIYEGLTYSSD